MTLITGQPARAKKDNAFVRELERLINLSPKTQIDIAEEIGYDNHNMMTMFKRGSTRVPLDKVVPLALAIDADAGRMLKLWFETYMPTALNIIDSLGGKTPLTAQEKSWLRGLRESYGADLPMYDPRHIDMYRRVPA